MFALFEVENHDYCPTRASCWILNRHFGPSMIVIVMLVVIIVPIMLVVIIVPIMIIVVFIIVVFVLVVIIVVFIIVVIPIILGDG